MAITLYGTVVSDCDTAGDFSNNNSGSNINATDDDFVQGTGAVGDKMSNTTELLVSDALTFTTAAVFDFSSAGGTTDEGAHFIGWVNMKTPFDATDGMAVMFRNAAGHEGTWNVMPSYFYKGGFSTRVINPSVDFDTVSTWSPTGNPAQLDDVTEMGFQYHTTSSIMGSFNNVQCDIFTVGFGVRADVGTLGTPNVYQDVVDEDQDTSFWGWHSSIGAKGGLYIGPATGSTASWFVDTNFLIKFLDENVAVGFYGIFVRGENTTCTFELANITAENTTNSRWSLILEATMGDTTGGFTDTSSTFTGSDVITLNGNTTMTGTTIIDGNAMTQNGATLNGLTVIEPTVAANEAYLTADDLAIISNCVFTANTGNTGHAIEITSATGSPFDFSNNSFPDFTTTGAGSNLIEDTGPTNAMIHNSSGSAIVINIVDDGATPVIRNSGAGSTTTVNNNVTVSVSGLTEGATVTMEDTTGTVIGTFPLLADENGEVTSSHSFGSDLDVVTRARYSGAPIAGVQEDNSGAPDFADLTTECNDSTLGNVILMPATEAADDAFYLGFLQEVDKLTFTIDTGRAGTWSLTWEYWNGAWVSLSNVVDGTSDFLTDGKVTFTKPTDSVAVNRAAQGSPTSTELHFVRARISSFTSPGAGPTATKVNGNPTKYLPFVGTATIFSTGLSVSAVWVEDTIAS